MEINFSLQPNKFLHTNSLLFIQIKGGIHNESNKNQNEIRMRESNSLCEIDSIYLEEIGIFFKKETIHDLLLNNPKSIYVDLYPYPVLQPVVSSLGEKYVRSEPDSTEKDNLLNLPRD